MPHPDADGASVSDSETGSGPDECEVGQTRFAK